MVIRSTSFPLTQTATYSNYSLLNDCYIRDNKWQLLSTKKNDLLYHIQRTLMIFDIFYLHILFKVAVFVICFKNNICDFEDKVASVPSGSKRYLNMCWLRSKTTYISISLVIVGKMGYCDPIWRCHASRVLSTDIVTSSLPTVLVSIMWRKLNVHQLISPLDIDLLPTGIHSVASKKHRVYMWACHFRQQL